MSTPTSIGRARYAPALLAAGLFALLFPLLLIFPLSVMPELLGVGIHILLFPVVERLRAPQWAKAAGYGWLVIDVAVGVLILNHVNHDLAFSVRLASHVLAGIWVFAASVSGRGAFRATGIALAICIAGYSFVSSFAPRQLLAPSALLMVAWLFLIGWQTPSEEPSPS